MQKRSTKGTGTAEQVDDSLFSQLLCNIKYNHMLMFNTKILISEALKSLFLSLLFVSFCELLWHNVPTAAASTLSRDHYLIC